MYSDTAPIKCFVFFVVVFQLLFTSFFQSEVAAAKRDTYDIIYILSKDLERVLDYKEELETIFSSQVRKRLKIVGKGKE